MHKAFSKNRIPLISIALLIVSLQASAGYSDQPDCQAVSNAAKGASNGITGSIDAVATNTSAAIARAKSCSDQVVDGANRAISNFGGAGSLNNVISQISSNLANQACALIGNAQAQVSGQVPSVAQPLVKGVANQVVDSVGAANAGTSPSAPASQSIWQRLGSIF